MCSVPRRIGFDDPLRVMQALHVRLEQRAALFARLAEHVRQHGSDADARATAGHVMRCFDEDCPMHHEDEEIDLFPLLRAAASPAEAARAEILITALLAQHQDMHAAFAAVRPQLAAIADGRLATLDPALVDRLHTLCLEHVELEELELFPFARDHLDVAAMERLGRAMAARRNAAYPDGPKP
jgi:iron-sulfur cluster repair protein YtfE (RIC family)